jgi:hypothetical protein
MLRQACIACPVKEWRIVNKNSVFFKIFVFRVLRCHLLRISRCFGETGACIFRIKHCLTFYQSASRNVPEELNQHGFLNSKSRTVLMRQLHIQDGAEAP